MLHKREARMREQHVKYFLIKSDNATRPPGKKDCETVGKQKKQVSFVTRVPVEEFNERFFKQYPAIFRHKELVKISTLWCKRSRAILTRKRAVQMDVAAFFV